MTSLNRGNPPVYGEWLAELKDTIRRTGPTCACPGRGAAAEHGTAAGLADIASRWSAGLRAVRQTWPPGRTSATRRATC